jgi:hypothetical protein
MGGIFLLAPLEQSTQAAEEEAVICVRALLGVQEL